MKSFYITTPIYYVNDSAHIGHCYTTIACDIIARYNKSLGNDVFFLTGTDEHGQKVEKAARSKNFEPQIYANKMSKQFEELIPFLNCDISDFIRTTEKRHIKSSQALWNKLLENNQIYLSNYEGWYSIRDEAFYTENELVKKDGKYYASSGSTVEWVKEESYFFKLSEWDKKLLDFYYNNPDAIAPKSRYNEVISFIKGGLKDLSISRTTFKWGVPVPNNNNHVMYVWIDALCNYLTAIGYPEIKDSKFNQYWPAVHIVGKDILRFHSVYWPAFLMAADLNPPKRVFAHGWWTNEGQKISKSVGNTIDPYEIINEYGLDQIRFFLFREVPFGNDGDFSKKAISKRVNADLSNNLGNLVQRSCTFAKKNNNSEIVNNFRNINKEDKYLIDFSIKTLENYQIFMNNQEIDKSLKCIFDLLTETNIYFDKQAPWNLKKDNSERMNIVISITIEMIRRSSILLYPVIPSSIESIFSLINLDKNKNNIKNYSLLPSKKLHINDPKPIFPRIEIND